MSEQSIGKGSLVMSANGSKLDAGLQSAKGKIAEWSTSVQSTLSQKLASAGKAASGSLGGALSSGLGMLKGGIAGLAAGFALGGISETTNKIRELSHTLKAASGLGIATDQYMGLAHLLAKVGIEGEGANKIFLKVGHAAEQASQGNKVLSNAFAELGINADELKSKSLDQQFIDIIDALHEMPEGAQRANLMMEVFGRQAGQIAPIMAMGRKELEAYISKQKALGNALSEQDAASVKRAAAAQAKMKEVWSGFANKIMVAVAPLIEMIGGKLSKAVTWLMPVFEKAARAIKTYWEICTDIFKEVWSAIVEVYDAIADVIKEMFNFGDCTMTVEQVVTAVLKAWAMMYAYLWDTVKAGAGIVAIVFGKIVQAYGWITEQINSLLQYLKDLPDALKPDWLDAAIDSHKKLAGSIKQSGKDMAGWGMGTLNNFGKAADQVRKWFDNRKHEALQEAHELKALVDQALPEQTAQEYKGLGAYIQGSKEAIMLENSWKNDNEMKKEKEHKDHMKKLDDIKLGVNKVAEMLGGGGLLQAA